MLRVRVVDNSNEGHPIVNVRMPLGLVKWGMKMGKAFSPQLKDVDVDWDEITTMLESTDLGKIVEVEDEEGARGKPGPGVMLRRPHHLVSRSRACLC